MSVKILIPTPLRPFTGQASSVDAPDGTVREVLTALTTQYGDVAGHLFRDDGALRSFVNVYVGDDDIRHLEGLDTKVQTGQTVSIIPSVAGGAPTAEAPPVLTND